MDLKTSLTSEDIADIIDKYQVRYEWWREYEMVQGIRVHTGYALRVSGSNPAQPASDGDVVHPVPGCSICRRTFGDLLRLARYLTSQGRGAGFTIDPYDASFHVTPTARGCREEVVATIHIFPHESRYLEAGDNEARCLNELLNKMKVLVAR